MADYLIQNSTLDAIADAINAKTGGSSAMTPAQMVTAIGSISGGGGMAPRPTSGYNTVTFMSYATYADNYLVFDFSNLTVSLSNAFMSSRISLQPNTTVKIKAIEITSIYRLFYVAAGIPVNVDTVIFDTEKPVPYGDEAFYGVKNVLGSPIRLSASPRSSLLSVIEIRFVENDVSVSANVQGQYLSNDSIVSLANALASATGVTLTLHANAKTKCNAITGYSESVTVDDVTYDRFIADENGTLTLMDFITNVKGWTVA